MGCYCPHSVTREICVGKSRGASVSPQQLQLEEQVRKVQYQSQQQEHQQQQIAAAFAELHRAQHALHQERLAFEAHKVRLNELFPVL